MKTQLKNLTANSGKTDIVIKQRRLEEELTKAHLRTRKNEDKIKKTVGTRTTETQGARRRNKAVEGRRQSDPILAAALAADGSWDDWSGLLDTVLKGTPTAATASTA